MLCPWMVCLALLPLLCASLLWGQPEAVISWVSRFHYHNVLSYPRPMTVEPVDGGMKDLKPWSEISCFYIKMALSAFCYSDRSDQHSECQEASPYRPYGVLFLCHFTYSILIFVFFLHQRPQLHLWKTSYPCGVVFGEKEVLKTFTWKNFRP